MRSFGTETRVVDNPIAASDKIHDFVCFRGQDIKDLHVHEVDTEVIVYPGALIFVSVRSTPSFSPGGH